MLLYDLVRIRNIAVIFGVPLQFQGRNHKTTRPFPPNKTLSSNSMKYHMALNRGNLVGLLFSRSLKEKKGGGVISNLHDDGSQSSDKL